MESSRDVSTARILRSDYPSLMMVIGMGVAWILLGLDRVGILQFFTDIEPGSPVFLWMAGIATGIFAPLAIGRVRRIRRILATGTLVTGVLTARWFEADRGRLEYTYSIDGVEQKGGSAVWRSPELEALRPGDPVRLVVDPEVRSRTLLLSLFTDRDP